MVSAPIKGLVIFNNASGALCYSRYFNEKAVLSKEVGYKNITFDQADPNKIAAIFYSMRCIANVIIEEYKDEHPQDTDPNTRLAFQQGFSGMKSDSVDYMLESHEEYPLTVALFYDSRDMDDTISRYFCNRILDIYVIKKEKILQSGNLQNLHSHKISTMAFESALPLILENVSNHL